MAVAEEVEFLRRLYEKQVELLVEKATLVKGASTKLLECRQLFLQFVKTLALTVEVRYHASATKAVRVHVRTSPYGGVYDSEDLVAFDAPFTAGSQQQKTVLVNPDMLYLKVIVENLDAGFDAYDVKVSATY